MFDMIKELCLINSVSGNEDNVRDYIISKIEGKCEYNVDALGNIIVFKKGKNPAKNKVMISAHMDEVGMIVTSVTDDGMLLFDTVGGVDARAIIGRNVLVGDKNIPGVIGSKAIHLQTSDEKNQPIKTENLYIDIGADSKQRALEFVKLGDFTSFYSEYLTLGDDFIKGKALDDRIGCAIMIDMINSDLQYDAYFTFVVQEEVGLRGAKVAAYSVAPDFAIVLEATTAADISSVSGADQVCVCGEGAVVSFMDRHTIYDKELYNLAFEVANENKILCQTKTKVAGGNDAGAIHTSKSGVRTLAISAPCRYLHTASCMLKESDVSAVGELAKKMHEKMASL